MTRLSVNINKIATLRNARGANIPDVIKAAVDCQRFGAQGITVHPRQDERHIRKRDVYELKKVVTTEFNIEGNPTEDFLQLIEEIRPQQVTLVPDAPDAITSNAGWDTVKHQKFLTDVIARIKSKNMRTSLFIAPDERMIENAKSTGTDRIELYTEDYATQYSVNPEKAISPYIKAAGKAREMKLGINAGHDLNLENLEYFVKNIPGLLEVSIGHALISDALYYGLENTIPMYLKKIKSGTEYTLATRNRMKKIKVSVVNYLNSKPFVYGLQQSAVMKDIELHLDTPSVCADKLIKNEVDVGLVPVIIIPEVSTANIVSPYCIAAEGEVGSVLLISKCPVEKVETVVLDPQSRTSNVLAQILFGKWWERNPQFVNEAGDVENSIAGTTAAVIIGDRALELRNKFRYVYDLATEWKKFTMKDQVGNNAVGLPFVFACWVTNKSLPEDFLKRFNEALKYGIDNKLHVAEIEKQQYPGIDITDYFTTKINYDLDKIKETSMQLFLSLANDHITSKDNSLQTIP